MDAFEFRTVKNSEWTEAMKLWVTVFGDCGWIFESLNLGSDDRGLEHTQVALSGGKIVSAVDIFMREQFDSNGKRRKVGAIGSVATYHEYRGKGLSGTLLLQAIQTMQRSGCEWSFLGTGVHGHYERYGWKRTPTHERSANLLPNLTSQGAKDSNTRRIGQDGRWPLQEMAKLHEEFNDKRPLTHLRSPRYWQHAIATRLNRPERRSWGVFEEGQLCGYLVASFDGQRSAIDEIAASNNRHEFFKYLVEAFCQEARIVGHTEIYLSVPTDPDLDPILEEFFTNFKTELNHGLMSRSLEGGLSDTEILEMFESPGALHYPLDAF